MVETIFECAEGRAYRSDSGRIGVSCNSEFPPAMAVEIERLQGELAVLTKRNKILEKKNSTSLANNLCPDHRDKQVGKTCLACTVETLERRNAALQSLVREYLEAARPIPYGVVGLFKSKAAADRFEKAEQALRAAVPNLAPSTGEG